MSSPDLTADQKLALSKMRRAVIEGAPFSLRGYAGTGKTTLVGHLARSLQAPDFAVAVTAPTNKAVAVLRDQIGVDSGVTFSTIQSLLGLRVTELEGGNQKCVPKSRPTLHEYNLVIVDECSMVNDEIDQRITRAADGCALIYVGDPAQLPPVGASNEVSRTFGPRFESHTLTEIVRQGEESPIISFSKVVRAAIDAGRRFDLDDAMPVITSNEGRHLALLRGGAPTAIAMAVEMNQRNVDARIIAFRNQAVDHYNREIHRRIYGEGPEIFCPGERVVAQEQFESWQVLSNGDLVRGGTVVNSEEMTVRSIIESPFPDYPDMPAWRVVLEMESRETVVGYVPKSRPMFDSVKQANWNRYQDLKEREGPKSDAARTQSRRNWAFQKSFAALRHGHASTSHKAQGSTYQLAIVDWSDMSAMDDAMFNHGIYVAVTRPREALALLVA